MELILTHCAAIDCHKKTLVVHRVIPAPDGTPRHEVRTVGTTTGEILALADWLTAAAVTHVGMESTGIYWQPVFNLLEASFTVWILNAQHVKNVPGRKTDMNDAAWLCELMRHGLVRPSFIPVAAQRDLRELTRERTGFVRQRATLVNRVQKVLEAANIKLGDVASDVLGRSGRAMLDALLAGQTDGAVLAELAQGRLRTKRAELAAALTGRLRPQQQFVLTELLCQIDSLDETIARFDAQIEQALAAEAATVALLDSIPGVSQTVAEVVVAEIGTDMSRWPTAGHLAAWAGLAPGNNESAGKRKTGRTRNGDPWLRVALVQAAHGAARSKDTYLAAQYHRIAARRGRKRAIVAVAHSILVAMYHMIQHKQEYNDLGGDYFERRRPERSIQQLIRQGAKLGYQVTLTPLAPAG